MTEIFSHTSCRQLSQMLMTILIFHRILVDKQLGPCDGCHRRNHTEIAILTASQAFTHMIRIHRDEQHKLVTYGVYRFCPSPRILWFSHLVSWNSDNALQSISTIAFAVVVWKFFADRIPYEEHFLRQFFGSQYVEYARHVPSGVPFIK
ncbi:Protein-S-isoprenylcysteine O-methyltransferase B [Vitis vinifera]|uniref:Protein-S-isoprenylcysteine O-methyltransferase n=1 Tax=Vitis vinifera TaxID=29760 RepID=A0A438EUQ9_VITVI|nr:Protein-S-isoprenylcysteine O-methyltransferase B [Vitis vinifera]